MVKETRIIFGMKDLIGIRAQCKQCGSDVVYPVLAAPVSHSRGNRLAKICPGCDAPWTPPPSHRDKVAEFFNLVRELVCDADLPLDLRFEMEDKDGTKAE